MRFISVIFACLLAACAGPGGIPAVVGLPVAPAHGVAAGHWRAWASRSALYRPEEMASALARLSGELEVPGAAGGATQHSTDAAAAVDAPRFPRSASAHTELRPPALATAAAPLMYGLQARSEGPRVHPHTPPEPTATPRPTNTATVLPTEPPTPTATLRVVERVIATWTAVATAALSNTTATPTLVPVPRPHGIVTSRNAAQQLAPASLPSTLAGVHFAGPDLTAAQLLGSESSTAWAVEVAYATDHQFRKQKAAELVDKFERGFRVILRIDYTPHQHIPPIDQKLPMQEYVDAFLELYRLTGGTVKYFVVGNEGNVDADYYGEERQTECEWGRYSCDPQAHALIYQRVRQALRAESDAYVLLGAVSPGTDEQSARWQGGSEYLAAVLSYLHPSEVDGLALHAYAPEHTDDPASMSRAVSAFAHQLSDQIAIAKAAGFVSTPLFLTELNQGSKPDPEFVRRAYGWIDQHNASSRQDIVAACWFVYHDSAGAWRDVALENQPDVAAAFAGIALIPPGR